MAFLARTAGASPAARETIESVLDDVLPLPPVVQSRREDGLLEHDPNMEIPGWGYTDEDDMPPMEFPLPVTASDESF